MQEFSLGASGPSRIFLMCFAEIRPSAILSDRSPTIGVHGDNVFDNSNAETLVNLIQYLWAVSESTLPAHIVRTAAGPEEMVIGQRAFLAFSVFSTQTSITGLQSHCVDLTED